MYYSTSGHGDSGLYCKSIANTTVLNEWRVLEWDMAALTAGGSDWTASTITNIRMDLGTNATDVFLVDWVTVGSTSPVAYSAAIQTIATAQATDAGNLYAQYTVKLDVGGLVSGYGLASNSTASAFGIRADRFWVSPPAISSEVMPSTNLYVGKAWYQPSTGFTMYMTQYVPGVISEWKSLQVDGMEQVAAAVSPFVVQTSTTTINGTSVPPGVYIRDAYIHDATITNAKIANLAVDNAKIASLSATKITAGAIGVGSYIQSTAFTAGSAGWKINADGTAELANAVVRGGVYATYGSIGGITIASNAVRAGQTAYDTGTGFYLGSNGTFSIGNSAGAKLTWNGTTLGVVGDITGSSGTFTGSITGASGTFSGTINTVSAASGARMEIKNNVIKVYDSAGTLRVQLGDLSA